jgi:hypothetical protein
MPQFYMSDVAYYRDMLTIIRDRKPAELPSRR